MRPKRPGLSSLGRAVAVTTNHFRVACTRWVCLELSCSDTLQSVVSHWCWGMLGACCILGLQQATFCMVDKHTRSSWPAVPLSVPPRCCSCLEPRV